LTTGRPHRMVTASHLLAKSQPITAMTLTTGLPQAPRPAGKSHQNQSPDTPVEVFQINCYQTIAVINSSIIYETLYYLVMLSSDKK
jgi:hypothetical protein